MADEIGEDESELENVDKRKLEMILATIVALLILIAAVASLIIIAPMLICHADTPPTTPLTKSTAEPLTLEPEPTTSRVIFDPAAIRRLNFTDAAEACENATSKLAFPRSAAEEAEIDSELKKIIDEHTEVVHSSCGAEFYIGLRRNKAREWESPDGIQSIFAPPLIKNFYTSYDYSHEHCVQMLLGERGILNNIGCDEHWAWPCFMCEYECLHGDCKYAMESTPENSVTTREMADEVCGAKYTDGTMATINHEKTMTLVTDLFKDSAMCDKPLIGNRYTVLYEDIYENPLLYRTNKIDYAGKQMIDACVTINVEQTVFRWTINHCTTKLCYLCYSND